MRLVGFRGGFGRLEDDAVIPMGRSLELFLATGEQQEQAPIPMDKVELLAPITRPEKIICVGLNYIDHAKESNQSIPEEPVLFAKYANSIVGPSGAVRLPPAARDRTDYEAELAVVIGRRASRVSEADAMDHVFGYTCANDISARDMQVANGQWHRGKAIDTFLPLGPVIVTADEVPEPQKLSVRCILNDDVVQDANSCDMIFGVASLISFISQTITLVPGDVICTGTPPGVGFVQDPPRYLREGDLLTVEIEKIGALSNRVVLE